MKHKKPEIHARLPQEQFDRLVDVSVELELSLSATIRHVIDTFLYPPICMENNTFVECTPKDCVVKHQGSLSKMLLTRLELHLDGFVYEHESDCTGEENRFNWAFGLDASDEYFDTAEDCLNNFLQYLNGLNFSYRTTTDSDESLPNSVKDNFCPPVILGNQPGNVIDIPDVSLENTDLKAVEYSKSELQRVSEIADFILNGCNSLLEVKNQFDTESFDTTEFIDW